MAVQLQEVPEVGKIFLADWTTNLIKHSAKLYSFTWYLYVNIIDYAKWWFIPKEVEMLMIW